MIIQNLTIFEEKQARKLFTKGDYQNKKLLKCFSLIKDKQLVILEQIVKSIYGAVDKNSIDAFRKLSDRLLERLYQVISNEINFQVDKEQYSEVFLAKIQVKRGILTLQSLQLKGLPFSWIKKYLNRLINICNLYEFLEDSLFLLRNLYQIHISEDDFENALSCKNEIEKKSEYIKYLIAGEFNNYLYIESVQHKSIDDKTLISKIKLAVEEVSGYFEISKLNQLHYQKLMLELQLFHFEEDYYRAEEIIYMLIDITYKNPSIRFKGRIAQNFMNLAYTQFFLHKYEEAFENSKKAATFYMSNWHDINLFRESGVFALIYLKKYQEADEALLQILETGEIGNKPEQLSKRHLMMAYIKYLLGDYKSAFKHLQETKEVESDREGWNLGIRMLNIYLTLSTEKVDLADQRIGSMRKHIERTAKMRHMRKRDMVIFRILSRLSRSGFDFKDTWEDSQKDFQLLKSDLSEYRWIPRSHELIIFDQWYESKMNGKPYDPVFPTPKIQPVENNS